MLEAEPTPCAPEACLYLVNDQQCTPFPADSLGLGQKFGTAFMHASLALNDLQHHRGRPIVDSRFELIDVVKVDVADIRQQRFELAAVSRVPSEGHRSDGAPVKTVSGSYDSRASRCQPRKLDRAVDRLRAAITYKGACQVRRRSPNQLFQKGCSCVIVKKVWAGVHAACLLLNSLRQNRMTVAEHGNALRRCQIEIALAFAIDHPATLASHHYRLTAPGHYPRLIGGGIAYCELRIGYVLF